MEPLSIIGSFASIFSFANDFTETFKQKNSLRRFINRCKSPIRILVLGDSGNGKTHFIHSIIGQDVPLVMRTGDIFEYPYEIPSTGRRVIFVDTPGNESSKNIRTNEEDKISKDEYAGIINVVSYGYSWADNNHLDDVFVDSKAEMCVVKEEYLVEKRKNETYQLNEWIEHANHSKLKWVFTVINKADLWCNKAEEVQKYYEAKRYHTKINKLKANIKCIYAPYCSYITAFGDKLPMQNFGEKAKKELYNQFMYQFLHLLEN